MARWKYEGCEERTEDDGAVDVLVDDGNDSH